ncbi:DMT family transporter [Xinfangfangia sp. CPCC 101601]|uniref:DMT family transporter n=1 Tax=Pseudogemmobacter lacusdianii TaxID=3069608 RepID=A0ABU0W3L4_9RHOB|nr:DMT family transporter [Xinfangfangia sp. CPCC 101601]MDQ2067665.1 DMT family transporter [Xinfangfangia sp. CPCC 101601]
MTTTAASENNRAAAMMTGSMAFFAVEDLFLKQVAEALPPGEVLLLTGFVGAVVFWLLAARKGQKVLSAEALQPIPLTRTLAEAISAVLYILALAFAPLSMTSALLQASPLVVVAGAALFLGEKVGWRRWSSVVVGFIGVLVILSPWDASFDATGILTVLCVLALALRDLSTRMMPAEIGTFQVASWAYMGIAPSGLLLMLVMGDSFVWPSLIQWGGMGLALFAGLFGYYAVVAAMRMGEVSVVAPFRYTRLIFAILLAMIVLGERPSLSTYIGGGIVVASGLYAFARGRVRQKMPQESAETRLP